MSVFWIIVGIVLIVLVIIAAIKKKDSVYANDVAQKNPFENKKVEFVEDDNDKENADGARGHLRKR